MAAISTLDSFVTWDEFTRLRNSQDTHLRNELNTLHHSIDEVRLELTTARDEVRDFRDEINRQFDAVHQRFNQIQLETLRMSARFRNFVLNHLTLRIEPVPAFRGGKDIEFPHPAQFPRHAREFYNLRHPSDERNRRMLSYLVSFYEVDLEPVPSDEAASDDARSVEQVIHNSELAVERLGGILGLNEENFIRFEEKAKQLARTSNPPKKRPQSMTDQHGWVARMDKLDFRAAPDEIPEAKTHSSGSLEKVRLGWGSRSTPDSQRRTVNNLPRVQTVEDRETEDEVKQPESDSPTNPLTASGND